MAATTLGSVGVVAWLEMGGVYALPNLRGGGEYGADWQEAGTRLNKQNTIDDFIAAAEWLVDQGYTSANKLVCTDEDVPYVFSAADFNFADVDVGDSLVQVRISSLPTAGSLEMSGVPVILNQVIPVGQINAGNLVYAFHY